VNNIIANIIGKIWILIVNILSVPIYLKLIGIEAFGLVGFFTMLLAVLQILEFGLGVVISRQIAQTVSNREVFQETRDLLRSLEVLYWIFGILIASMMYVTAPFLAQHWLNSEKLSTELVINTLRIMGIVVAFHWPISLYVGSLVGMERQVLLNLIQIVFGTIRTAGAVCILLLISPTVEAFFYWQLAIAIISVGVFSLICWRVLPHRSRSAKFSFIALCKVWRFAAGLGATGAVTFLLSNLDKIILSKLLALSALGHYNIANQMNMASRMLPAAVFQALFPRFASFYAAGSDKQVEIVNLYHNGSQLISSLVFPAAITLSLFSFDIIQIWLQNDEIAGSVAPIASILILGSMVNAVLGIPYEMTVARGWSIYGFYQNLISVILIVPLMIVLVWKQGALGAAISWLILNIGYLLVAPSIMASRTLPKGELQRWYLYDLGIPFLVCVVVGLVMRFTIQVIWHLEIQFICIAGTWLVTQLACITVLPAIRKPTLDIFRKHSLKF
jgi:O-antigen/teichoic acid export membrane protein